MGMQMQLCTSLNDHRETDIFFVINSFMQQNVKNSTNFSLINFYSKHFSMVVDCKFQYRKIFCKLCRSALELFEFCK